ncbi:MAG: hypothetical protein IPI00_06385 [Flavobacteriales bacterium]|nr:hypothetical protein [Flavobacteriales bacterium]
MVEGWNADDAERNAINTDMEVGVSDERARYPIPFSLRQMFLPQSVVFHHFNIQRSVAFGVFQDRIRPMAGRRKSHWRRRGVPSAEVEQSNAEENVADLPPPSATRRLQLALCACLLQAFWRCHLLWLLGKSTTADPRNISLWNAPLNDLTNIDSIAKLLLLS